MNFVKKEYYIRTDTKDDARYWVVEGNLVLYRPLSNGKLKNSIRTPHDIKKYCKFFKKVPVEEIALL